MFGGHFYHERVRKAVAVFGTLFNDLNIIRTSNGQVISQLKVPLSYGPKRSFLDRIEGMANGEDAERQLAIKLPRMSFEILGISYDPSRQLPKMNNHKVPVPTDANKQRKFYVGAPYTINFQLNVYAKSQDDALQIVEQIIPYFTPQYTVSMFPYDDASISEDVPIILTTVSFSDDYEGNLEQRRTIIYTLDFEMKLAFYGPSPAAGSNIIREIDVNFFDFDNQSSLFEAMVMTPTPIGVSADSDWTLNIEILDSAQP